MLSEQNNTTNNNNGTNTVPDASFDDIIAASNNFVQMLSLEEAKANAAAKDAKAKAEAAANAAALAKAEAPPPLRQRAKRTAHRANKRVGLSGRLRENFPQLAKALENVKVERAIEPQPPRQTPTREAKQAATRKLRDLYHDIMGLGNMKTDEDGNQYAGSAFLDTYFLLRTDGKNFQLQGKQLYSLVSGDGFRIVFECGGDLKEYQELAEYLNELDGVRVVGKNVESENKVLTQEMIEEHYNKMGIKNGDEEKDDNVQNDDNDVKPKDAKKTKAPKAAKASTSALTVIEEIRALTKLSVPGPQLTLEVAYACLRLYDPEKGEMLPAVEIPTNLEGVKAFVLPLYDESTAKEGAQLILTTTNDNRPGLVLVSNMPGVFVDKSLKPVDAKVETMQKPDKLLGESSEDEMEEMEDSEPEKLTRKRRREEYEDTTPETSDAYASAAMSRLDSSSEDELWEEVERKPLTPEEMAQNIANARALLDSIEASFLKPSDLRTRSKLVKSFEDSPVKLKRLFNKKLVLRTLDACAKTTNAKKEKTLTAHTNKRPIIKRVIKTSKQTETQQKKTLTAHANQRPRKRHAPRYRLVLPVPDEE